MNKSIFILPLVLMTSLNQFSLAKEAPAEISRSCLKEYPIASGETDVELISLYAQLCDKNNKKNDALKQNLTVKTAQRFQALGNFSKTLQVVDLLRSQNINSRELTDLTFLAGIGISQSALAQMRNSEMRYLNQNTYASAKQLADAVQYAQPEAEKTSALPVKQKDYDALKSKSSKQHAKTSVSNRIKAPAVSSAKSKSAKAASPASMKKDSVPVKPAVQPASGSPFAALN